MPRKCFLKKIFAMLLIICAVLTLLPATGVARENEILQKPITWWDTSFAGIIYAGAGDENKNPIKATSWYFSVDYEFKIYFNGTAEENCIEKFDSVSNHANAEGYFGVFGEGTYYYKVRAIEVKLGTNFKTGNVSPWSEMSEGFEYRRPEKTATTFDINIEYTDCNISGGKYLDFIKDKGYAVVVHTIPFFISTCDLHFEGYPFEARIEIRLPYGSAYFESDSVPDITINGRKADVAQVKNDLTATAIYKFEKKNSAPYVKLGSDGEETDLTKKLGQSVNIGGGTATLTQNGDGYLLELENVRLNGGAGEFLLITQEYDEELGKYVHEKMERTFGIRANRDVTIVLKGKNSISSADAGVYYGIAMEEASAATFRGDGTLDIYAGGIAENGWGGTGDGYGIITGTAFGGLTVESGKINIYPIAKAYGIFASDLNMRGGELTVDGNENRAAIKTGAFGALRMYGGKMTVHSEQRAENSGAIETEGGIIHIAGGELTAVCKNRDGSYGRAIFFDSFACGDRATALFYYGGKATLIGEGAAMDVDNYAVEFPADVRTGSSTEPENATDVWTGETQINNNENIKTVIFSAPSKKMIDTIKIEGAKLSYEAGERAVYTAGVCDEDAGLYEIIGESWSGSDGKVLDKSTPDETFGDNAEYYYYLGIELSQSGGDAGYRFADDVKLILNGEEVRFKTPFFINSTAYDIWFFRAASFRTGGDGVLCGDVNNDGAVDITDAMLVLYHVAEKKSLTAEQLSRCDTNDDGVVDIFDAMKILYYVAGKSDSVK